MEVLRHHQCDPCPTGETRTTARWATPLPAARGNLLRRVNWVAGRRVTASVPAI